MTWNDPEAPARLILPIAIDAASCSGCGLICDISLLDTKHSVDAAGEWVAQDNDGLWCAWCYFKRWGAGWSALDGSNPMRSAAP